MNWKSRKIWRLKNITQQAFTYSKSTIETLERLWNKVSNKTLERRQLHTYFTPSSSVSIVIKFEQVKVNWVGN